MSLRRLVIEKRSRYPSVLGGEVPLGLVSFLDMAKVVLEEQGFENRMPRNDIRNGPEDGAARVGSVGGENGRPGRAW